MPFDKMRPPQLCEKIRAVIHGSFLIHVPGFRDYPRYLCQ